MIKGRMSNFGEASNSNLALKAQDPTLPSDPKPCLLQNTKAV